MSPSRKCGVASAVAHWHAHSVKVRLTVDTQVAGRLAYCLYTSFHCIFTFCTLLAVHVVEEVLFLAGLAESRVRGSSVRFEAVMTTGAVLQLCRLCTVLQKTCNAEGEASTDISKKR